MRTNQRRRLGRRAGLLYEQTVKKLPIHRPLWQRPSALATDARARRGDSAVRDRDPASRGDEDLDRPDRVPERTRDALGVLVRRGQSYLLEFVLNTAVARAARTNGPDRSRGLFKNLAVRDKLDEGARATDISRFNIEQEAPASVFARRCHRQANGEMRCEKSFPR